jgi:hypothetical protein
MLIKKISGLAACILTVLLTVPGPVFPGSGAYAQSGSGLTESQRQELEQKSQEQWDYLERLDKKQEDTGSRLQGAGKRRQDAEKRQREAERQMRQLEKQPPGGKSE